MNKAVIRFIIVWLVNSLVVYLASYFYPVDFVLGTYMLTPVFAALLTGFLIAGTGRLAKAVFAKRVSKWLKGRFGMFVFYFLVNSIAVWLFARLAPVTGFGITAFYWAFVLGLTLSLIQWGVRQVFKALKLV